MLILSGYQKERLIYLYLYRPNYNQQKDLIFYEYV